MKKNIYLNYEIFHSFMNIRSCHKTSNGFKYSCYDEIETRGPYVSEPITGFEENDLQKLFSIVRFHAGSKITWEDDDCWAESFWGTQRDYYEYEDLSVCSKLNELFSEKYQVLFKSSEQKLPIFIGYEFMRPK